MPRRQQLSVLQRKVRGRVQFTNSDRLFFIQLYRWFPAILKAMTIIRPETLVRWHRAGFGRYWGWKSRNLGGRPRIDAGLRALIRRMSIENMLWGAPRIHGELLKLGFAVAQSTVAKYMAKIDGSPSGQSWGIFLRNHMPHIAALDLFRGPGALLNAVVEGLRRLPETRLPKLPRMADFALWATACETALWPAGTFWSGPLWTVARENVNSWVVRGGSKCLNRSLGGRIPTSAYFSSGGRHSDR